MAKQQKKLILQNCEQEYPFWKEIKASWIANQSHCYENSPSKRKSFIEKGIYFSPEWTGKIGFLRYYIFHIDNGYVAGKSKLQRKDPNKGFSPENCIVMNTNISKNIKNGTKEKKTVKKKPTEKDTVLPIGVNNNFIIIDSKKIDIEKLLSFLSTQKAI